MTYKLFLDDERFPVRNDCFIARTFEEARDIVSVWGIPAFISFDHDLGAGLSGKDFANWLVEFILNHREEFEPSKFSYDVHSQNPVGAAHIRGLLDGFLEHLRTEMATLCDRLQNDQKAARIAAMKTKSDADRIRANILTLAFSNVKPVGTKAATTDAEAIAILTKMVKNGGDTLDALAKGEQTEAVKAKIAETQAEIDALKDYLPKQMTEDELRAAIGKIKADTPDAKKGQYMGALKASGQAYDGKLAAELVDEALAE